MQGEQTLAQSVEWLALFEKLMFRQVRVRYSDPSHLSCAGHHRGRKDIWNLLNRTQKRTTPDVTPDKINRQPNLAVAAAALLLSVVLLLAYISAGALAPPTQTLNVQPSPPASEGASQQQGREREARVWAKLREEGYEQPFGENDQLIRQNLQLKPGQKVADFVGRSADGERYLVAESKGNDLSKAIAQLRDTAEALWRSNSGANLSNTEFRIYVNDNMWSKLQLPIEANRTGGYTLIDGSLATNGEAESISYFLIQGRRILVLLAL